MNRFLLRLNKGGIPTVEVEISRVLRKRLPSDWQTWFKEKPLGWGCRGPAVNRLASLMLQVVAPDVEIPDEVAAQFASDLLSILPASDAVLPFEIVWNWMLQNTDVADAGAGNLDMKGGGG